MAVLGSASARDLLLVEFQESRWMLDEMIYQYQLLYSSVLLRIWETFLIRRQRWMKVIEWHYTLSRSFCIPYPPRWEQCSRPSFHYWSTRSIDIWCSDFSQQGWSSISGRTSSSRVCQIKLYVHGFRDPGEESRDKLHRTLMCLKPGLYMDFSTSDIVNILSQPWTNSFCFSLLEPYPTPAATLGSAYLTARNTSVAGWNIWSTFFFCAWSSAARSIWSLATRKEDNGLWKLDVKSAKTSCEFEVRSEGSV